MVVLASAVDGSLPRVIAHRHRCHGVYRRDVQLPRAQIDLLEVLEVIPGFDDLHRIGGDQDPLGSGSEQQPGAGPDPIGQLCAVCGIRPVVDSNPEVSTRLYSPTGMVVEHGGEDAEVRIAPHQLSVIASHPRKHGRRTHRMGKGGNDPQATWFFSLFVLEAQEFGALIGLGDAAPGMDRLIKITCCENCWMDAE